MSDPNISNANGRKRIPKLVDIRQDTSAERLKLLGDSEGYFVYHMTKGHCEKYTLQETQNAILKENSFAIAL